MTDKLVLARNLARAFWGDDLADIHERNGDVRWSETLLAAERFAALTLPQTDLERLNRNLARLRDSQVPDRASSVPEQDSLGEREAIVAWLDDHLKAGACLSLSWIIDAIEAGEHLTRQALEQGSGEGSRATASRQPAGGPSDPSQQVVSAKGAHQAQGESQ